MQYEYSNEHNESCFYWQVLWKKIEPDVVDVIASVYIACRFLDVVIAVIKT